MMVALPAGAAQESGSLSCSSNVAVRSLTSSGTTRHYVPSGTLVSTYFVQGWDENQDLLQYNASSWKVTATGAISEPNTYGYCWGV